jgi:hypothetical protein
LFVNKVRFLLSFRLMIPFLKVDMFRLADNWLPRQTVLFVTDVRVRQDWAVCRSPPTNAADPHHLDADPDPDPACHFDADPDPACHFYADPDPACHFDADPDPDPTFHLDAVPDPDSSFQIKAQNLKTKKCQYCRLIFHTVWFVICKLIHLSHWCGSGSYLFNLMRIRIRIRMQIRIHNTAPTTHAFLGHNGIKIGFTWRKLCRLCFWWGIESIDHSKKSVVYFLFLFYGFSSLRYFFMFIICLLFYFCKSCCAAWTTGRSVPWWPAPISPSSQKTRTQVHYKPVLWFIIPDADPTFLVILDSGADPA